MMARPILTLMALALAASVAAEAQAQLFGNRSVGSSISRRTQANDASTVGTVSGSERYIRGNRGESNFVGTDAGETRDFVGAQTTASAGASRVATPGVQIETAPDANRMAPPSSSATSRTGLYRPRLVVGFQHPKTGPGQVSTSLSDQLAKSLSRHFVSPDQASRIRSIEVSVEDGTATLRGVVSSERERSLVQLLTLFEPGIVQVQNELEVRPLSGQAAVIAPEAPRASDPTAEPPKATTPRDDPATPAGQP